MELSDKIYGIYGYQEEIMILKKPVSAVAKLLLISY